MSISYEIFDIMFGFGTTVRSNIFPERIELGVQEGLLLVRDLLFF